MGFRPGQASVAFSGSQVGWGGAPRHWPELPAPRPGHAGRFSVAHTARTGVTLESSSHPASHDPVPVPDVDRLGAVGYLHGRFTGFPQPRYA